MRNFSYILVTTLDDGKKIYAARFKQGSFVIGALQSIPAKNYPSWQEAMNFFYSVCGNYTTDEKYRSKIFILPIANKNTEPNIPNDSKVAVVQFVPPTPFHSDINRNGWQLSIILGSYLMLNKLSIREGEDVLLLLNTESKKGYIG
jgi:hypothetical protein